MELTGNRLQMIGLHNQDQVKLVEKFLANLLSDMALKPAQAKPVGNL